jgi:hypothetical protein
MKRSTAAALAARHRGLRDVVRDCWFKRRVLVPVRLEWVWSWHVQDTAGPGCRSATACAS